MSDLRAEANGGSLPPREPRFGEARPLLGNTQFRMLPDRRGGAGTGAGPAMSSDPTGGSAPQQSAAGFSTYFDEQVAGSPRRMGGGRRAGARFTEGPMRGRTADQAKIQLRSKYAGMSPEEKMSYEGKARGNDISVPVAGPKPAAVPGAAPAAGAAGAGAPPVVPASIPDPAADAAAEPMGYDVASVDKSFLKAKVKKLLPGRQSSMMTA